MKAIQTKPMLYAHYLNLLQEKARDMGYNLVLHGSLSRDCDLIAIPWTDEPKPHLELIQQLDKILTGCEVFGSGDLEKRYYMHSVLPGGRHSYVINLNRRSEDGSVDHQFYLDISVTPFWGLPCAVSEEAAKELLTDHLGKLREVVKNDTNPYGGGCIVTGTITLI